MAYDLRFTRIARDSRDPVFGAYIAAARALYDVGHDSVAYIATCAIGERAVLFVRPDGSAFGGIDADPAGLVRSVTDPGAHPGLCEYLFDPGTFDPGRNALMMPVVETLFA